MPSYVTPKKNTALVFYISLEDKANPGDFKASPTLAAGDVVVATDDGVPGNITTLPVVDADFTKRLKVSLSAAEMNGDNVTVIFSDVAGAEWYDLQVNLQTSTRQIDDLAATGADSDTLKSLSDQIDGAPAAVWAVASGGGVEDSYGNILDDLTTESGGTYAFTTAALAAAPGGGGTLYSYTNTVDDGSGNLLDGVFIQLATDSGFTNIITTTNTNVLGAFTVRSDTAGTHYLRLQLAGYSFTDQTVTLA